MKIGFLPIILILLITGLFLASIANLTKISPTPSLAPTKPVNTNANPDLGDWGSAPEIQNDVWINTDEPLRLANLRGKVVLLEMWTYGCYNCRNVVPSLKGWHEQYADQGLVVIGNHYPEFEYERDLENLKQAVTDLELPYPITQDNDGVTWRAYSNRYWPTLYLIDKRGHIRYRHIGEGSYRKTEEAIQDLLAELAP